MAIKRPHKPQALEFSHPLKVPLERWLLLDNRMAEVEDALVQLLRHLTVTKSHGRRIKALDESIRLIRPLFCFAVITYARCYGSGRRQPLKISDVPRLSARDLHVHEEVRLLRNQHFAHAVADEEGAEILVIPSQHKLKPGFVMFDVVLAGFNAKDVRAFLSLVRKIRRFLKKMETTTGNALARAIFGPKATWTACLENGSVATKLRSKPSVKSNALPASRQSIV